MLPDGDVLVADSLNDRVIVIENSSKKIIWQYGHTHKPGSSARLPALARQRDARPATLLDRAFKGGAKPERPVRRRIGVSST